MVEGPPKAHLQNGHHVPGSLWDTLWKYSHMVDMINDVFYTQQLKSPPEVKLRECWMEWGWRRTFNCEKRTPNKNTLEQINNYNHNNIYVGLDNDFMKIDHIVCTLKEILLIILLYTQVRLRICDLKVDLYNRILKFISQLQFSVLWTDLPGLMIAVYSNSSKSGRKYFSFLLPSLQAPQERKKSSPSLSLCPEL